MGKKEIVVKTVLIAVAILLFLHSLKIANFLGYNTIADLSGFSENAMQNSALVAIALAYLAIGLFVVFTILLITAAVTKRKFKIAFNLLEATQKQATSFSDSLESNAVKIFAAIGFGGLADVMLLYLGVFKCITTTHSWGSSTSCPPANQVTFLFAGTLCLVYAIFPKKVLFKTKIKKVNP